MKRRETIFLALFVLVPGLVHGVLAPIAGVIELGGDLRANGPAEFADFFC